jgi:uncharacterized protein
LKSLSEIKAELLEEIPSIKKKYDIKEIGIFGSYIRGQAMEKSDLDILVDFNKTPTLLKFANLENRLTDRLGLKVDLVMKNSLKPQIGKEIMREVMFL